MFYIYAFLFFRKASIRATRAIRAIGPTDVPGPPKTQHQQGAPKQPIGRVLWMKQYKTHEGGWFETLVAVLSNVSLCWHFFKDKECPYRSLTILKATQVSKTAQNTLKNPPSIYQEAGSKVERLLCNSRRSQKLSHCVAKKQLEKLPQESCNRTSQGGSLKNVV